MSLIIENLPEAIRTTKQQLRAALPEYKEVFSEVEASPHATAVARMFDPGATPRHDLDAIRARCDVGAEDFDGYSGQQFMVFGPRWGSLRRVEYGRGEALVTTVMPDPFVAELQSLWLHPALLDMATGSAQALIPGFSSERTISVPHSRQ